MTDIFRLRRRLPAIAPALAGVLVFSFWAFSFWAFSFWAAPATAQSATPACPDWIDPASVAGRALPYTCYCDGRIQRHSAYGVFRYAIKSHVCTAARHDGRVGLRGGRVTLYFGGGCAFYREAWRNGIQSKRAEASPASFAFIRPLPPCTPKPRPRPRPKRPDPDTGISDD